ncbi:MULTISPECIES: GNAT family N-acetyltransferase [Methanobacterium]|jgi:ribosomal protein S18 acetylase RimI-like enzyme|uniref:GNAT family N-acetyltransferase n=1 Tax=Methanobacterium formicicum TaxID=2162 RepID=A0A090I2Y6_METFO|nr:MULTISPECIES: GNAT family N-acetyltransferase [Methanobacterium]KUK74924.1 MAG: Acetyltransferase [Methanobacterium sp. 42_16]MBF4474721.1 GNAT family N-acetyltransferase [Methanobacterium formicicum]MDG3548356.1 GNAT family N-acetyltransferase [Methanobacterium formicicum]MDH2660205.1 GNAT family N-acetyltransferase [Methanobacterium formicicum]CEA13498.1 hypothetical protein DSM1535_1158 [Methanobacterium formicicum]
MENMIIVETDASNLNLVQPLWEKLNQHHLKQESNFKEHYAHFTFQKRVEVLLEKSREGDMHIGLVKNKKSGIPVAYCITTINPDKEGEIDSIYVAENCRGQGWGDELMKRSLKWMKGKGVTKKSVRVSFGNQETVPFYERYGFCRRSVTLEQIPDEER